MKKAKKIVSKKGFSIGDLLPVGITLVVVGIALAFGLQVMGDVQDGMTVNSAEYNATGSAIEGVAVLPTKLTLIATVAIAVIVIGLVLRFMVFKGN